MRRSTAVVGTILAVFLVIGGCSGDQQPRGEQSAGESGNASPTVTIPADTTPTTTFGQTLQIVRKGFARGSAITRSANLVEPSGRVLVEVTIATKQGTCIPGSFFALTDGGTKVENLDLSEPGILDESGQLIAGERRQGDIAFDVPPGATVTKIVLYHGTINPPKAYWTA
ncbi:hypothetical protein [Rhodococcus jostii]|uniref:DUF4352 domain-containing protein n=1 Tax=Rhodococcus jostii TaxID=132919 RepID=A0A1H4J7K5_RHOJO|nr:hypothetical protein [Rhodococcus jostii]SEB42207.1 hypothetical protein SAMN04490220_0688 [Rhodococcus jostii]